MGIRLTGISTPFGGLEWEYKDKKDFMAPVPFFPDTKIKVFISSICGDKGKYDDVRTKLKKEIEETNLADVYIFEDKGASTLSAENHYVWSLENSDVCIFLIDNADDVSPGVQKEIDTVKRCNIKSLYYFCDETQKEKTVLEQGLMGAKYAKSKTVHKFDELSQNGAQDLINDIVNIYLNYCRGNLISKSPDSNEDIQLINLPPNACFVAPTIPKAVLNNIDKCKEYILTIVFGFSGRKQLEKDIKSSEIDEWGRQFLEILFEAKSIKNFNTGMFLDTLKAHQDDIYFGIVSTRWQAIQSYFGGDIKKSIEYLETALKLAKESNQPPWVIQDILIDLRNEHNTNDIINHCNYCYSIQKEIDEFQENVYYPVLDRINKSLHENYINGIYEKKIESPYTVTLGNNYDQYGALLASSYIVSIYNGSLTHILHLYDKIKDFIFYLSYKYNNYKFRKDLLKFAILNRKDKEIEGIQDSYPEVLNKMNEKDAAEIMSFCNNNPISYQKVISQLLAFGSVGYYLNDSDYKEYEKMIIKLIYEWLDDENGVVYIGLSIFKCLYGIAHRMSQDELSEICCSFLEKKYIRYYMDMFKFIYNKIDINKMSEEHMQKFIQHIIAALEDEKCREEIKNTPSFLFNLRKQNISATNELDKKISKYLSDFYNTTYKLETTDNKHAEFQDFIQKYIEKIKNSNETQGKNGIYFSQGSRDIATVRAILLDDETEYSTNIMDQLISAVSDTLIVSKEGLDTKLDAISLLICIVIKYPDDFIRNMDTFKLVVENKDTVCDIDNGLLSTNIDIVSIRIALALLGVAMGENTYADFLECMAYVQNDTATMLSVMSTIIKYLEIDDSTLFPVKIESIILQNILQWLQDDNLDVKWNATRVLLMLIRNPENINIINQKIINLIDTESAYIKNLILQRINKTDGFLSKTKDYVFSKCENDPCFIVRKVCMDIQNNQNIK